MVFKHRFFSLLIILIASAMLQALIAGIGVWADQTGILGAHRRSWNREPLPGWRWATDSSTDRSENTHSPTPEVLERRRGFLWDRVRTSSFPSTPVPSASRSREFGVYGRPVRWLTIRYRAQSKSGYIDGVRALLCLMAWTSAVFLLMKFRDSARRSRWLSQGKCPSCGYTWNTQHCSECGFSTKNSTPLSS